MLAVLLMCSAATTSASASSSPGPDPLPQSASAGSGSIGPAPDPTPQASSVSASVPSQTSSPMRSQIVSGATPTAPSAAAVGAAGTAVTPTRLAIPTHRYVSRSGSTGRQAPVNATRRVTTRKSVPHHRATTRRPSPATKPHAHAAAKSDLLALASAAMVAPTAPRPNGDLLLVGALVLTLLVIVSSSLLRVLARMNAELSDWPGR
jgi:hypothetical protein